VPELCVRQSLSLSHCVSLSLSLSLRFSLSLSLARVLSLCLSLSLRTIIISGLRTQVCAQCLCVCVYVSAVVYVCVPSFLCTVEGALHCVAVCCSELQCVVVCCSVLQCVAVCCSVSQRVAVCTIVPVNGRGCVRVYIQISSLNTLYAHNAKKKSAQRPL